MDSLVVLAGLCGVPAKMAEGLEKLGWNVQRLGTLDDGDEETVGAVIASLEEHLKEGVSGEELLKLVEVASKAAKVNWRVEGKSPEADLLVAHATSELFDKVGQMKKLADKKVVDLVPKFGTAKLDRWPTRLSKKLNMAGDNPALRESIEKNERTRWIKELRQILEEADSPATQRSHLVSGVDMVKRFGKGRRASTLRKHVKTWQKVRAWLMAAFQKPWPVHPEEIALYLESRAQEPCGKSVPGSIYKTLLFMENAGEWPVKDQVARAACVKNALEEINMQLAELAPRFTRKAWHLPVKVIMALEDGVMNTRWESYRRIYCWYRLVKVWTGMRFSDTCGLENNTMELNRYGLTGVLKKTKTTGPGKKVQLLRVWVSHECWLVQEEWLEEGFNLWTTMSQEAGIMDRDYMLPCPSKGKEGFGNRMVTYALASRFSQALFLDLRTEYEGARVPLMSEGLGTIFTEHSERTTMRTWAEAAGVPESVRKQLGRWTPTVDQAYERTGRLNTLKAQGMMAKFIKRSIGKNDPFDEALVLSALAAVMDRLGYPKGAADIQLEKMRAFGTEPPRKWLRLQEPDMVIEEEMPQGATEGSDGWHLVEEEKERPVQWGMASEPMDSDEEGSEEEGHPKEAPVVVSPGTFVVSIIGRSGRKTLHRIGECHRIPGIHYNKYEIIGDEVPGAELFHQSCKICFPRGTAEESESEAQDLGSEDCSSSDTSTSVEDSEEERP